MNFFNRFRKQPIGHLTNVYEIETTLRDCDCGRGCESIVICQFSENTVFLDGDERIHISDVRRGTTLCGQPIIDIYIAQERFAPYWMYKKKNKKETHVKYMGFTIVIGPKTKKLNIGNPVPT